MLLTPGTELGRYRLEGKIGAGGMAEVWRAIDATLERPVAVKILIETVSLDETFARRFFREAKVSARLEHPNILPVYDFGEYDGLLFIVMRLVTGGTVRDRARKGVPHATSIAWVRAIASALDFAHAEGVVHRDVKPANVLLDRSDTPLLADFGLAKPRDAEQLTVAGTAMGTPVYMSPEALRGEELTPRSDQYSLGVLAYYLLTGQPPFEANSMFVVMTKTLYEEPGLATNLRSSLHRSVDYVLLKVLEKSPEGRFESCGAFADALAHAVERNLPPPPSGTRPGLPR